MNAWQRADRTDVAAIEAQMAEAERIKNMMRMPIRRRGLEITAERLAATEANITTLREHDAASARSAVTAEELLTEGFD